MKIELARRAILTAVCVSLVGCAAQPTLPTLRNGAAVTPADVGMPPEDAEAVIRSYLDRALKDPDSARIKEISGPRAAIFPSYGFAKSGYGWVICYSLNAKNSYGAYTGFNREGILWREGRVVDVYPNGLAAESRDEAYRTDFACNYSIDSVMRYRDGSVEVPNTEPEAWKARLSGPAGHSFGTPNRLAR